MVEEGSPQELLARGGRYAELWARQASLDDVAAPDSPGAGVGPDGGDDKEQVQLRKTVCVSASGGSWCTF